MGHGHSQHRHAHPSATATSPSDKHPAFIVKLKDALLARTSGSTIDQEAFSLVFSDENREVATALFGHFLRQSPPSAAGALTPDDFMARCGEVCDLISGHDQVEFYLRSFSEQGDVVSAAHLRTLVLKSYSAAMWSHPDTASVSSLNVDTILAGVVDSILHGRDEVSVTFARNWVLQHCPLLLSWLHQYVLHCLTSGHVEVAAGASGSSSGGCVLDSAAPSSVTSVHPALLWLLMSSLPDRFTRPTSAESLPSLSTMSVLDPAHAIGRLAQAAAPKHWVSLYSSDEQGLSASRLQHHVLTYRGPTIALLRAEEGRLFCVAADVGWRDSPHYWGGADCMALQLLPQFQVLCSHQADVMFYNQSARGLPAGLRVGADRKTPAIAVDKEMSLCTYRGAPFRLEGCEVWGCGAPTDREQQVKSQKRDQAAIEQRRKVNIMADTEWGENPDKYLLEMSGAHKSYNYN